VNDARGHALHVLSAAAVVPLDGFYRSLLVDMVELEDPAARSVEGDLDSFREGMR
jgi:hypothetical protein